MLLITFMWSIAGVVSRQLESASSFEVTFWRAAFTVLSLAVLMPLMQGRRALTQIAWRNPALLISAMCWAVMFTAFMLALTLTTVANVLITMALGPLFTALLARFALGQALPMRTWAAIAAAGAGITYMYAPQINAGASMLGSWVALGVPIAAGVQWTLTQSMQRQSTSAKPVDLIPAVLLGALISSAVTLPLAYPFSASGSDIAWLALLGLVQLAIPCALSVVCARVLAGPEIALLALLEVIFGIALVWAFGGETPDTRVLLGGAVVVLALAVNEFFGLHKSRLS